MTIKIWNTYSCNNSSSFRMIARFAGNATATAVAAELREFFTAHAAEIDERGDYSEEPSQAQRAFGTKHGYEWTESLQWGDSELVGDEPDVFVRDNVLIVQHTYCGGGLELEGILEKLGGSDFDTDDTQSIDVSLLFRVTPGANAELESELGTLFAQLTNREDKYAEIHAPWAEHEVYGKSAQFRDNGTVGIYMPIDPRDLDGLDTWIKDRGIDKPSVQIGEKADLQTFAAIAKARCTSCNGAVDYLDPRIHDIETPQLVCKPCGGLYELSTFLPAT